MCKGQVRASEEERKRLRRERVEKFLAMRKTKQEKQEVPSEMAEQIITIPEILSIKVREAIESLGEAAFTRKRIQEMVGLSSPAYRGQIGTALRNLAVDGFIKKVGEEKVGHLDSAKAYVYQRVIKGENDGVQGRQDPGVGDQGGGKGGECPDHDRGRVGERPGVQDMGERQPADHPRTPQKSERGNTPAQVSITLRAMMDVLRQKVEFHENEAKKFRQAFETIEGCLHGDSVHHY